MANSQTPRHPDLEIGSDIITELGKFATAHFFGAYRLYLYNERQQTRSDTVYNNIWYN